MIFRDLGAHIDGFIAVAAHTVVVGATADCPVTGRKADVILAAYWASQAALRLLKPLTNVRRESFHIDLNLFFVNNFFYFWFPTELRCY